SICGKDYYTCPDHVAGRNYDVESAGVTKAVKCVLIASDFNPIELSIVNIPANDTSTIFVLNENENDVQSEDFDKGLIQVNDSKIDEANKKEENDTVEEQTDAQTQTEVSQDMFKKIAKDFFVKNLELKNLDMNEETKVAFDGLFETIDEKQVKLLSDFLEKLSVKVKDNEETVTEEGTVVVEETALETPEAIVVPEVVEVTEETVEVIEPVLEAPEITEETAVEKTLEVTKDNKEVALEDLYKDNKKTKEFVTDNKHLDAMLKFRF
ncbi:MAG: hypothetical protein ACRC5T_03880, partial [Cetobacterium sp.]